MPFTRGAQVARCSQWPAEGGIRSALGFGKGESAGGSVFKNERLATRLSRPMLGESAATTARYELRGPGNASPHARHGGGGIDGAGGYKIARLALKGMLLKPDPKGSAAVTRQGTAS